MRAFGVFIATCGYVGYVPVAPGTAGSAAGLLLVLAVQDAAAPVQIAVIALLLAVGVWSSTEAERHFGGVDPGPVVIDEVAGMFIALALIPVTAAGAIVGFLLFRLLDIIKPWPSGRLEALPGGLGVMADDAMAALYANLLLRGLVMATPAGWLA